MEPNFQASDLLLSATLVGRFRVLGSHFHVILQLQELLTFAGLPKPSMVPTTSTSELVTSRLICY